jgi:hypothetical protein
MSNGSQETVSSKQYVVEVDVLVLLSVAAPAEACIACGAAVVFKLVTSVEKQPTQTARRTNAQPPITRLIA